MIADAEVEVTWLVAVVAAVIAVGVCCLAFGAVVRTVVVDVCFIAGAAGRSGGKCGDPVLQADDIEARLRHFRAGSSETWQIGGDGRETETC